MQTCRIGRLVPKGDIAPTRESGIELTCERELHWECQLLGALP